MLGIKTIFEGLHLGRQLSIDQLLSYTRSDIAQRRNQINRINGQTVSIGPITYCQFKRRVDVALLLVTSHMQVVLTGSLVGQPVDEPWIRVEVENKSRMEGG